MHGYDEGENSLIIQWVHTEKVVTFSVWNFPNYLLSVEFAEQGKKANRLNICFEGEDLKRHELRQPPTLTQTLNLETYGKRVSIRNFLVACSLSVKMKHSCSKLHCQKVLN